MILWQFRLDPRIINNDIPMTIQPMIKKLNCGVIILSHILRI